MDNARVTVFSFWSLAFWSLDINLNVSIASNWPLHVKRNIGNNINRKTKIVAFTSNWPMHVKRNIGNNINRKTKIVAFTSLYNNQNIGMNSPSVERRRMVKSCNQVSSMFDRICCSWNFSSKVRWISNWKTSKEFVTDVDDGASWNCAWIGGIFDVKLSWIVGVIFENASAKRVVCEDLYLQCFKRKWLLSTLKLGNTNGCGLYLQCVWRK